MIREQTMGWTAVVLSTFVASFWAWWGITDNFHEGWYFASFLQNVGWMLYRYMSPMIVFLFLGILSAAVAASGRTAAHPGRHPDPAVLSRAEPARHPIMIIPLLILGVLYYRSSPPPFLHAVTIMAVFPILLTMVLAIEPVIRIMNRVNDGNPHARVIQGNGVVLVWAPEGPGWPDLPTSLGGSHADVPSSYRGRQGDLRHCAGDLEIADGR